MKQVYTPPLILKVVSYQPKTPILKGSVVTKETKIRTAGQDLDSYTIETDTGFNTTWE